MQTDAQDAMRCQRYQKPTLDPQNHILYNGICAGHSAAGAIARTKIYILRTNE